MMTLATSDAILDFWFGALEVDGLAPTDRPARWFERSEATDADIRAQFGDTLAAARAGSLAHWESEPRPWLALIIVLDQFSRNLYRQDEQAWSYDASARAIAQRGLSRSFDRSLHAMERAFVYLVFEHSESIDDQEEGVRRFQALRADCSPLQTKMGDQLLHYACAHRDVIAQFGRFPHRNAVLNRPCTDAEQAYLDSGGGF